MSILLPDPRERPLLRAEEAAPFLRCGRSAVHDAMARGEVPSVRIGRNLYVPTAGLRQLLGIDPPGVTADQVLAALRVLLNEKNPGATPGSFESTTTATITSNEESRAA